MGLFPGRTRPLLAQPPRGIRLLPAVAVLLAACQRQPLGLPGAGAGAAAWRRHGLGADRARRPLPQPRQRITATVLGSVRAAGLRLVAAPFFIRRGRPPAKVKSGLLVSA